MQDHYQPKSSLRIRQAEINDFIVSPLFKAIINLPLKNEPIFSKQSWLWVRAWGDSQKGNKQTFAYFFWR